MATAGRESTPDPITLVYKTISTSDPGSPEGSKPDIALHLDFYPPTSPADGDAGVPAIVYFHGGGLVVGDRKSWFPGWLLKRLSEQGVAFLSADYRLLSPSTGHDIVEDIQDLFAYIRNDLNPVLAGATGDPRLRINLNAIGVAGSSAGGLCTYLCAMHLSPKPRALLSVYGQAGECLNDQFLEPKTKPYIPNVPLVDPSGFAEFLFPQSMALPIIAESPVEYYPTTHPTPGLPATKRMQLSRLYYQLGQWLDYYTGDHTLSQRLRQLRSSGTEPLLAPDPAKAGEVIGEKNIKLFPQFGVTENWPPTLLVHGTADSRVPFSESKHLAEQLTAVGVENELIVVDGREHAFDILVPAAEAEREFGRMFDRAVAFLVQRLRQ
ncbi:Alpha/Beta hydrolase protein [Thelephora terrestris]|uniref:Alpha/Beta hydrolase protein n=1 Tax=Thelephora terrestris TaxID=56493 RepID=A0A9P6HAX7_9AGAM|nr:Alpha/Beta hydrolase protein [Thelephora terrestris]